MGSAFRNEAPLWSDNDGELVIGSVNNMIIFFRNLTWKKDSINIYDDPSVRFASTPRRAIRFAKLCNEMSYRLRLRRAIVSYAFITIGTYLLNS